MNLLSNLVTSYKNQLKKACEEGNLSSIQKILEEKTKLINEVNHNHFYSLF